MTHKNRQSNANKIIKKCAPVTCIRIVSFLSHFILSFSYLYCVLCFAAAATAAAAAAVTASTRILAGRSVYIVVGCTICIPHSVVFWRCCSAAWRVNSFV